MRLTTALLCSALALLAPVTSAAHADPLCEAAFVAGLGGGTCIPYGGDVSCGTSSETLVGTVTVDLLICLPRLMPSPPPGQPNTAR